MERKGFPESYDRRALLRFVMDVKSGASRGRGARLQPPRLRHRPGRAVSCRGPDILIVEGLNVLQPAGSAPTARTGLAVSDFFDFSVYVDADPGDIRDWYVGALPVAAGHRVPRPALVLHPLRRADPRAGGPAGRAALGHHQRPQPGRQHPADPRSGHGHPAQGQRPPGEVGADPQGLSGGLGSRERCAGKRLDST